MTKVEKIIRLGSQELETLKVYLELFCSKLGSGLNENVTLEQAY